MCWVIVQVKLIRAFQLNSEKISLEWSMLHPRLTGLSWTSLLVAAQDSYDCHGQRRMDLLPHPGWDEKGEVSAYLLT